MYSPPHEMIQVGEEVRLRTKAGDYYQGLVFCVDKDKDVIILEEPHLQSVLKQDVRIFKYSMVDNVEVLTPAGEIRDLPPFSKELIQKNEKEGLQRGKRDFDRIGKDVSPQAQLLFNSLDKTYRLRWESKDIRINELGIVIKSPYNPENCSGKDLAALERIKLLVAKINERIRSGELTL